MAIRRRKLKSGYSFEVYWKDLFTGKTAGKTFPSLSDAKLFEADLKRKIALSKRLKNKNGVVSPVYFVQSADEDFKKFQEKCLILYHDEQIRTADLFDYVMKTLGIPTRFKDVVNTVILFRRGQSIPRKLRFEVLQRDGFQCRFCRADGKESKLHVDHIIPVARGGLTELGNLQVLCESCNLGKGDSPLEAL